MTRESNSGPLDGLRILVVEDMLHLAWEMCDELRAAGAAIVGPTGQIDQAIDLVGREPFDAAVLDVALAGQTAAPIARALQDRQTPFVLVSGYSVEDLEPPMNSAPLITKPVAYPRLIEALTEMLAGDRGPAGS